MAGSSVKRPITEPPQTATQVLPVAAELFRKNGYAATTTRQISDRLGIQKASLYYHIESKEQLLYEICRESLRRVSTAVSEATRHATSPLARIHALIRAHTNAMLKDYDMNATMLFELRSLAGPRQTRIIELRDQYQALVHNIVDEGQKDGSIRGDIDSRHLTLILFNLLNWTMVWFRPDHELKPDDLADMITKVFLEGAQAAPG